MKINPNIIKLIIGIGNPGKEYEKTYHNVGFLFIDYLSKVSIRQPASWRADKYQVSKSDVFMNQSGGFAAKTIKKNKVKPEELLIVHDDSDIELGKYKISFGRGSAGHNGVESIIKALKTKNFWRLRIGIRKTGFLLSKFFRQKAGQMVLKKISKKDLEILEKVFEEAAKKINY